MNAAHLLIYLDFIFLSYLLDLFILLHLTFILKELFSLNRWITNISL